MNGERDSCQVSHEFLFRKVWSRVDSKLFDGRAEPKIRFASFSLGLHHQASPSKQGTSKVYHSHVSGFC